MSLFLLFAMMSFYICFDTYIEGSEYDKREIVILTEQLEQKKFELQMAALNAANPRRQIASINSAAEPRMKFQNHDVDLADFYFMRSAELKRVKKNKEALEMLDQVHKFSGNDDNLARADYETIAINCENFKLLESCVQTLDKMVTQYPQSEWTGRGLIWLSKSYQGLSRGEEAHRIAEIIKNDFSELHYYPQKRANE